MTRLVLLCVLALAACKNQEPPPSVTSAPTPPATPPRQTTGQPVAFHVPGFGDPAVTHVAARDGDRAMDVYTYPGDKLEVMVIDLGRQTNLVRARNTLRDRISFTAAMIKDEADIKLGDVEGIELRYIIEEGGANVYAHSRIFAVGTHAYHVRGMVDRKREAVADKFVAAFAFN